ncbi:Cytochrome P450 monooxygenase yanH [Lasiodiplodia hormozganensis]|uniref:Cytochrome P450 monooxygenase yanH n=1 Tax=Lasiodiplodia hormozganensis TaxID=869390 RepID=A0AA40D9E5_9PEZI|nr:Cytochrome P450 monooxygenase yanH [Lasiodiplodia hormozganensis]
MTLLNPQAALYAAAIALLSYAIGIAVYRRFFHPLAKIPGPFLPAVTTLYQSYYNGRYFLKIAELHEKYGPVVRITPNEIHLSDPDNYDKIYYIGTRFWKSPVFYGALCVPHSTFGTPSNDVHKHKRAMINPMFSRKMVLQLENVVQDKARKLIGRMEAGIGEKKPVDLHHAFRSVSVDVITDYAFDKCYNLLDSPDLGAHFFALVRGVGPAMWVFQQFPSLQRLALKTPPWLAPWLSEPLGHVTKMQTNCVEQVEDVKARMAAGKLNNARPTIFSELLSPENNDGWPIPTSWQLKDECYSFLAAAADTTGNAMSTACYHTLANRGIYARLKDELVTAFPDASQNLDFSTLEKLPYLTAVIKEGLRLSFGVPGRLPRVTPKGGATFNNFYVPEGTIVGMSSWLMHRNEDAFPDPMKFDPSRWLDPEDARRLDHYMVPFGKGSRQCVGMPLAYCELYVTLGTFFRRFSRMELHVFETTRDDLDFEDFFSGYYIAGKKWFKAVGH